MSNTNVGRLIGGTTRTDGIQTLSNIHQTKMASVAWPISQYSEGGVVPALALDFIDGKYRLGKTAGSFSDAFIGNSPRLTYETDDGSGDEENSTMVNSAGEIVWAPHNLVDYSDDLTGAAVAYSSLTIDSADTFTFTNSGSYIQLTGFVVPTEGKYTARAYISGDTPGDTFSFEMIDNADGSDSHSTTVTVTSSPQWVDVTADFSQSSTFSGNLALMLNRLSAPRSITAGSTVTIKHIHLYRSDLGGMHPVPGAVGDFQYYVPTNGNAEYLPRVGHHVYNGSAWVNEGLLIESEARTNLVTHSEDFSDASWLVARGTAVLDTVGPDGVSNSAATVTDNGATGTNTVYTNVDFTVSTSTAYTFSVFAKADQLSHIQIRAVNFTTPAQGGVYFDLSAGTVGTADAGLTGEIEGFGNGWHRCSVTFTTDAADTTGSIRVFLADGESLTVDLDGTSSVLLYGAQLEEGSTPSSYMPTNGGTYTRTAQSLTVPPAEFGWPEPEYIGSDLAVEGSHSSLGSDWSYANGVYTASGAQTASQNIVRFDNIGIEEGKVYSVSCDIANRTAGNIGVKLNGGVDVAFSTNGTHTATLVGLNLDGFQVLEQNGFDGDVSNISVREINPLSVSIQMDGRITYADDGAPVSTDGQSGTILPWRWWINNTNYLSSVIETEAANVGDVWFMQEIGGTSDYVRDANDPYSPGINVPFNISSRHGSTFVNGAVDGVALTEDTTPTALPDLSGTNLQIAYDFMGTIGTFRQFAGDIGDAGLETSSDPGPSLSLTFDGSSTSSFLIN